MTKQEKPPLYVLHCKKDPGYYVARLVQHGRDIHMVWNWRLTKKIERAKRFTSEEANDRPLALQTDFEPVPLKQDDPSPPPRDPATDTAMAAAWEAAYAKRRK